MAKPTAFFREEYERLVADSLDWQLRILESASGPHSVVDGTELLMLCANNYLNLTNHPKVKAAAQEAIATYGAGSGSVRPIAGNLRLHEELEQRIATFKGLEAALVYSAGFTANSG
ncbi:MAG: aminotransferase class I/II-fold pyridoxal phosphate-dependent enzyme, partial [Acidimicrobiia bacterium]